LKCLRNLRYERSYAFEFKISERDRCHGIKGGSGNLESDPYHHLHNFKFSPNNMLFTKAWMKLSRTAAAGSRRVMSTGGTADGAAGAGLVAAVGTTFVTYMTADFLSNFLQHPTQRVSESAL
jgi:hypothetical protein